MTSHTNITGYNQWANFYDSYPNPTVAIDDLTFPEFYDDVRNESVLEIGCGTGRHTKRLIELENTVVGVDVSAGMLEKARQKINSPNASFIEGDILDVQIPNAPFDSIVMSLVLEHISDLNRFFSRSAELLKAKGRIFFSEIHPERIEAGIMAHFKQADGEEFHLESRPHTELEIRDAANRYGFEVEILRSVDGVSELAKMNSRWAKYLDKPMIQVWVLRLNG